MQENQKLIVICVVAIIVIALIIALVVFEMNNNSKQPSNTTNTNTEIQTNTATTNSNIVTNSQNSNVEANSNSYISKEKAQEIALENAGISASNTRELKVELDYENGKEIYEVDFKSGGVEYNYDIDPVTGNIIKVDKDKDD